LSDGTVTIVEDALRVRSIDFPFGLNGSSSLLWLRRMPLSSSPLLFCMVYDEKQAQGGATSSDSAVRLESV